jgi:hypothetical protein
MQLSRFLAELFSQGHVRLDDAPIEDDAEDRRAAEEVLAERGFVVAGDFPEPVPELDLAAAGWAARQFCAVCHFVLFRDAPIEVVRERLSTPIPAGEAASQHFSVERYFVGGDDQLTPWNQITPQAKLPAGADATAKWHIHLACAA